jgi:putative ABC transport system substrate-binding protein
MRRRDFIRVVVASAAAFPFAARAQQPDSKRRIGVLSGSAEDDQDTKLSLAAFQQRLQQLGWTDGHNVRIDYRFAAGKSENYRKYAAELVALAPDVILVSGTSLAYMLEATRTVPIVFAFAADPVGAGMIDSLSRPGGNATGFVLFEYDLCAKWLELLKEIAPGVRRVAVLRDPAALAGIGQFAVIQSVARSVGVDVSSLNMRDTDEIERAVRAFASSSNGGLIVAASIGGRSAQSDHRACDPLQTSRGLLRSAVCRQWRSDLVWSWFWGRMATRYRLRRPHTEG